MVLGHYSFTTSEYALLQFNQHEVES